MAPESRRETIRDQVKKVVLPAPFGPMIAHKFAAPFATTDRVRCSLTATKIADRLVTLLIRERSFLLR